MSIRVVFESWLCLFFWMAVALQATAQDSSQKLKFFETKIRPVLVEHCYECHDASTNEFKGGLALDSRHGLLKGGDSGPALVPERPEDSLLIEAMKYGDLEMPPSGPLAESVVVDFEKWIRDGAFDPRTTDDPGSRPERTIDLEAGREHWAYQPIRSPPIPDLKESGWPEGNIDRFILKELTSRGLAPAVDAPKRVLIRRLYLGLIGLPPSPAEIKAFMEDSSKSSYANMVDRLLDSPRFGERWGRHWLDVVRYAESVTLRGFVLKEAWRYRDYVIETFNEDRAIDQFFVEQIAGDLLPYSSVAERQRQLIGTTFLMMGNANLEDQNKAQLEMDFVDEQLDVIGRGMLGQTVTCARCHDHKFDPIPTRDYYALAGILKNATTLNHANISKWVEVPLPLEPEAQKALDAHNAEVKELNQHIQALKKELKALGSDGPDLKDEIVQAADLEGWIVDDEDAERVGEWKHSTFHKHFVNRGYTHDKNESKGEKTLTFFPKLPAAGLYEVRLSYQWGSSRAKNVPVTVVSADGNRVVEVDESKRPNINNRFVSLGTFRFNLDEQECVIVGTEGTKGYVIADAVQFVLASDADAERKETSKNNEEVLAEEMAAKTQLTDALKTAESELAKLRKRAPEQPMTMSLLDHAEPKDLAVHIRGNVGNLGEVVPRGFLKVISLSSDSTMPTDQSGRLQLARWLVNEENPLTARVMANRVWHWLMGVGLVRTVDNFGTTGESPSHPELLDYLATQLVEQKWSMKSLIREIVLSRTYQLVSEVDPDVLASDPENRWYSHMNRIRLDAEVIRDAMLVCSGELDLEMGGATFPGNLANDYDFVYEEPRRSVYVPAFRNSLPEVFELFDFANVSMVTGRRDVSTVAPQALFFMNHPLPRRLAQACGKRILEQPFETHGQRVEYAFLVTLGRLPNEKERALSLEFLSSASAPSDAELAENWTQLIQSLFSTIDFRYVQ